MDVGKATNDFILA